MKISYLVINSKILISILNIKTIFQAKKEKKEKKKEKMICTFARLQVQHQSLEQNDMSQQNKNTYNVSLLLYLKKLIQP